MSDQDRIEKLEARLESLESGISRLTALTEKTLNKPGPHPLSNSDPFTTLTQALGFLHQLQKSSQDSAASLIKEITQGLRAQHEVISKEVERNVRHRRHLVEEAEELAGEDEDEGGDAVPLIRELAGVAAPLIQSWIDKHNGQRPPAIPAPDPAPAPILDLAPDPEDNTENE